MDNIVELINKIEIRNLLNHSLQIKQFLFYVLLYIIYILLLSFFQIDELTELSAAVHSLNSGHISNTHRNTLTNNILVVRIQCCYCILVVAAEAFVAVMHY